MFAATPAQARTSRDFKGFMQYPDGEGGAWRFQVIGFDWRHESCTVLRSDGTDERVSIDKRQRILIDGRRYSNWNH